MDRVDNDQNKEGECGGCGQLCLLPAPAIPTVILIAVRAANANFSRRRRRLRRGKGTNYAASASNRSASTTTVAPVATTSKLYPVIDLHTQLAIFGKLRGARIVRRVPRLAASSQWD